MVVANGGDGIICGLSTKYAGQNFFLNWMVASFVALGGTLVFSSLIFYKLYWPTQVTYEKWCRKTNPKYPTPEKVRDEIIQTIKSVFWAALAPAFSLWLYGQGEDAPLPTYGFCGTTPEYGWRYNLVSFFVFWLFGDFFEWGYHLIGHSFPTMWNFHRHHHVFFNPTPFAVIADEFMDQFSRALPLLVVPLCVPINLDILYFTFAVFFYCTGIYHHCGHELKWPNAHTGFFNTSYHHYLHHSISVNKKPYHCGFLFQIWDQLAGSIYPGKCFCVLCQHEQGLRSREKFAEVVIQDYSKLLRPSFWLSSNMLAVITGTSGADKNEELMGQEKDAKSETTEAKEKESETKASISRRVASAARAVSQVA